MKDCQAAPRAFTTVGPSGLPSDGPFGAEPRPEPAGQVENPSARFGGGRKKTLYEATDLFPPFLAKEPLQLAPSFLSRHG